MPLTADSIVQEVTGTSVSTTSPVLSLPSGTVAGNTVIAVIMSGATGGSYTMPTGWVQDVTSGSGPSHATDQLVIMRKSGVAAGETSWTISVTVSPAPNWSWYVCEVAGLDVDPLDASGFAYSVGITAGVSANRSTGTTSANGGMDTLIIGAWGSESSATGSTAGTWSGYTNGFEEAGQVGSSSSTSPGEVVAVARKLSGGAATGPFSSTATITAGAALSDAYGCIAVYRSADSPVVNPLTWQLGFEHGSHFGLDTSLSTASNGLTGIVRATSGTPGTNIIVQSSSAREAPSAYGCRLTGSAAVVYVRAESLAFAGGQFPANAKGMVVGMDVRPVSGSGTIVLLTFVPASGSRLQLVYDTAASKLGLQWGANTPAWQAGTTPANTWAWVDVRIGDVTKTTWHADWRVETAPGVYTAQTAPADLTGQASGTNIWYIMIGYDVAQTATYDVDNIVASTFAGSYPLGPHTLQALRPDPAGVPSVTGTVGNFALVTANATGAALTAGTLTSARDAIDDIPPVISASSDGVVQINAAATDYLEFPLETVALGDRVIAGARMLSCLISTTGAGAGNLGVRGWDGVVETAVMAVVAVTPGSSTTLSISIPPWDAHMWNTPGGWTQAKIDAAAVRIGYSGDATPDMGVHAVCLEVATRPALRVRQVSVEDDAFTLDLTLSPYSSASVSYTITSNDAARGVTFNYSLAGVAQSPVYVAPAAATTVAVTVEAFGDVSDVTLLPDAAT